MTTDQRHKVDKSIGQQVSPTSMYCVSTLLCFNYSPPNIFFYSILGQYENGTPARPLGGFGFARNTSRPFTKPKESFFSLPRQI